MNTGKYVFSQVASFLDANEFKKCVERYNGNYKVKHFTCWHQLMCMIFGQLSNRDSLSDLLICLNTQKSKWYHLGFGTSISKSNLAHANEQRDWRIFADYTTVLIAEARKISISTHEWNLISKNNIYAIDTTTVDLCLSVFWWAKFRQNKGAIRLHTMLDIKTEIPCFMHITDGKVHETNVLDIISFEANGYYVVDRAFVDFKRLNKIELANAYFVTRSKNNLDFTRIYSATVDRKSGIICDQTIQLNGFYVSKDYPKNIRRIKYYDSETGKRLIFLTNNFSLPAIQIAQLYKARWKIELFFKWIKQHLKVKVFWGHSENAVKVQIYCAMITFLTVSIIKSRLKLKFTQYEILQILSITLLNKIEINQLFEDDTLQNFKELNHNQLILWQ